MKNLVFIFLCITLGYSLMIPCDSSASREYSFFAEISGLGGALADQQQKKQKTVIQAKVLQQCDDKLTLSNKESGYLFAIKIATLQMGDEETGKLFDYTKEFSRTIYFSISINGKIHKVYKDKRDEPWISTIKKNILSQFHTKVHGFKRMEPTSNGLTEVHYEKKMVPEGGALIRRYYNEKDIKEVASSRVDTQTMRLDSNEIMRLDKHGFLISNNRIENVRMGATSARRHKAYENMKRNVKYEDNLHPSFETRNNTVQSSTILSRIEFISAAKPFSRKTNEEKQFSSEEEFHSVLSYVQDDWDHHESSQLSFQNMVETTIMLDEDQVHALAENYKQEIKKKINFANLLIALQKKNDLKLFASALEYIHYHPVEAKRVYDDFMNVYLQYTNSSDKKKKSRFIRFLKQCQTILLAAETNLAQALFLKTLLNEKLIGHGIRRAAEVKTPSENLMNALLSYENYRGKDTTIPVNAYLVLAELATRAPTKFRKSIYSRIINNLKDTSQYSLVTSLHALGNAGDICKLELIEKFVFSNNLPIAARVAAVKALRKRTKNSSAVSKLLNKIAKNTFFPNELRNAAIVTQTQREQLLQKGESMKTFSKMLLEEKTPHELKQSIQDYIYEHGSEEGGEVLEAHNILSSAKFDSEAARDEARAMFFRRFFNKVRGGFRHVGRKIGNVAKKAGKSIAHVAKKAGKAVVTAAKKVGSFLANAAMGPINKIKSAFGAAKWKHRQICINGGPKAQMCLYDPDMVSFVQDQGDLRNNVGRAFTFEKLIGAEAAHLYAGCVGYIGTRIRCNNRGSNFQFNAFARGQLRANFFARRFNIIQAAISVAQPIDDDMTDKVFLQVGPTVLLDKSFIPESVKRCEIYRKPLWKKEYPKLVDVNFKVVIVVVPATFSVTVGATLGVDLVLDICIRELRAVATLEPYVSVSVTAGAAIGIPVLKAGVQLVLTVGYRLQPNFGLKDCKVCAKLDHSFDPITVNVQLAANVGPFKKTFNIYTYNSPRFPLKTIASICSPKINVELGQFPEDAQDAPQATEKSVSDKQQKEDLAQENKKGETKAEQKKGNTRTRTSNVNTKKPSKSTSSNKTNRVGGNERGMRKTSVQRTENTSSGISGKEVEVYNEIEESGDVITITPRNSRKGEKTISFSITQTGTSNARRFSAKKVYFVVEN